MKLSPERARSGCSQSVRFDLKISVFLGFLKTDIYLPEPMNSSAIRVWLFQTTIFSSRRPSISGKTNFSWKMGFLPPSNTNHHKKWDGRIQKLTLIIIIKIQEKSKLMEESLEKGTHTCTSLCSVLGASIFKTDIRILSWYPFFILQVITSNNCKPKISHINYGCLVIQY